MPWIEFRSQREGKLMSSSPPMTGFVTLSQVVFQPLEVEAESPLSDKQECVMEMLRFNDFIFESFDSKPYSLKRKEVDLEGTTDFGAKTKSGYLDILISFERNSGVYSVDFAIDDDFFVMTATNEPFKILATVVESMKQFILLYREEFGENPPAFVISTNKDTETDTEYNRHRVYIRMVERFAGKIGYKLTDTHEDTLNQQMMIILKRK